MKRIKFDIEGQSVAGHAVSANGRVWVHVDGETFMVESAKSNRRGTSAKAGALDPGQIAAPMPGKIIKVMVAQDTSVEAGQVLLVMEAMKMEYTLKAQVQGRIESIECTVGEQVALGQILMKLETKKSGK